MCNVYCKILQVIQYKVKVTNSMGFEPVTTPSKPPMVDTMMAKQKKAVVRVMQATWHQRRPKRLIRNSPTKTDGSSVLATIAKLTNWFPAKFSTFIWLPR